MTRDSKAPAPVSAKPEIDAFLEKVRALGPASASGGRGRLIFALDATMSRQPTWDMACQLQADMFKEAASIGSLDIRLVYYRGLNECRATDWISDAQRLAALMSRISCEGGQTQIRRVLMDARKKSNPDWARFAAVSSNVPFVAIAQGRNRLAWREIGWLRPAAGLAVFFLVLLVHP